MSIDEVLDAAGVVDPSAREHYRKWLPLERRQGEFFADIVLEHLPQEVDAAIRRERYSLLDFGCSCGHLVKRLQDRYGDSRVEGIDIERIRIEAARQAYPGCVFHLSDAKTLVATYDVIFSSNVLEHFAEPIEMLAGTIAARARRFIITLVPYREADRIPGHLFSFDDASFPTQMGNFSLTHHRVIDCTRSGPDCWPGSQVLTVYTHR